MEKTIYRIWQLPHNNGQLFRDYKNDKFDIWDYCCVWWDDWDDSIEDNKQLENIYVKFNADHPEHFAGHSMSVSDLIEIIDYNKKERRYYYCSSFGFTKINI